MNIDPKTMLFRHLNNAEKAELLEISRALVQEGKVPARDNKLVSQWLDAMGCNTDREFLPTVSISFPQHALLSLLVN